MRVDGGAAVMIEDEAFGADGRALHRHARAAGDEDQRDAAGNGIGRHVNGAAGDFQASYAIGRELVGVAAGQKRGDGLLAFAQGG